MYEKLALFRQSSEMARHAGQSQAQIARNIANADTPGYRAKALRPFDKSFKADPAVGLKTTHPKHLSPSVKTATERLIDRGSEPSPNGNTVSLEDELLSSAEASSSHRRALAIYSHAMTVLRTSLGR